MIFHVGGASDRLCSTDGFNPACIFVVSKFVRVSWESAKGAEINILVIQFLQEVILQNNKRSL